MSNEEYGTASIYDEKGRKGRAPSWRVRFYWQGEQYSAFRRRKRDAIGLAARADEALDLLRRGLLEIPLGANRKQLKRFVFSGGKETPVDPPRRPRTAITTISGLLDDYLEQAAPPRRNPEITGRPAALSFFALSARAKVWLGAS